MFKNRISFLMIVSLMACFSACTFEQKDAPKDCTVLQNFSVVSVTPAVCGEAVGVIEVMTEFASGFDPDVRFQINGSLETSNPKFEGLVAGTYEIMATYNGTCSQTLTASVENGAGLNITLSSSPSDCGASNGQVEVSASGATGALTFSIDGTTPRSQSIFENLAPGEYTITAKDAAGCEVNQEVKVSSKVETLDIETIVANNCALSNCHGGNISPNFSVKENIKTFAGRIQQRTSNKTMPPPSSGNTLDQSDIDAIACWVFDNN